MKKKEQPVLSNYDILSKIMDEHCETYYPNGDTSKEKIHYTGDCWVCQNRDNIQSIAEKYLQQANKADKLEIKSLKWCVENANSQVFHFEQINKKLVGVVEEMLTAWVAIPEGNNSVKVTQKWIVDNLHPVIQKMRNILSTKKQINDSL